MVSFFDGSVFQKIYPPLHHAVAGFQPLQKNAPLWF